MVTIFVCVLYGLVGVGIGRLVVAHHKIVNDETTVGEDVVALAAISLAWPVLVMIGVCIISGLGLKDIWDEVRG
jgi:hypothetical protein